MPRCLADRYGTASGALGLDGSSGDSTRFSEVSPGMGPTGMERTPTRPASEAFACQGQSGRRCRYWWTGTPEGTRWCLQETSRLCSQVGPLEDKRGRTAAEERLGDRSAFGLGCVHLRTNKEHYLES